MNTDPLVRLVVLAVLLASVGACRSHAPTRAPPTTTTGESSELPTADAPAAVIVTEPPAVAPSSELSSPAERATLEWLQSVDPGLGDLTLERLDSVESVRVSRDFETEQLHLLQNLPGLRELIIWRDGEARVGAPPRPAPTDEHLRVIAALTSLRTLTIGGWSAPFGDDGLRHLAEHGSLESLRLAAAQQVSDTGMQHVARMPRLHTLDINYTNVTEVGLAALLESSTLRDVSFAWAADARRALALFKLRHPDRPFLRDD